MFDGIKKSFGKAAEKVKGLFGGKKIDPTEQALQEWGFDYRKMKDGSFFVAGNMNISGKHLKALPDFSNVVLEGNFSCLDNDLTSLKGAPKKFATLMSDFGVFWEGNIPPELLRAPKVAAPAAKPGSFDL